MATKATRVKRIKKDPWKDVPVTSYVDPAAKKIARKATVPRASFPQMSGTVMAGRNNRKRTNGRPFMYIPREVKIPIGVDKNDYKKTVYARVKLMSMKKIMKPTRGMCTQLSKLSKEKPIFQQ